jgi:hypothetical protein
MPDSARFCSIAALSILLLRYPAHAEEGLACPEAIVVEQHLANSIPGWSSLLDDTPHRLAGITFYDGPPEQKASLVSDKRAETGRKQTATWHFHVEDGRQIWLACSYAATSVALTKSLPRSTSACSVTYDRTKLVAGLPLIDKITCR